MKIVLVLAFGVFLSSRGAAQEFIGASSLPPVSSDAFYRIALTPDVSPYINTSFSNFRVVDRNGAQVPFLIREDRTVPASAEFIPYVIEEQTILPDSCTVLILRNNGNTSINNISLLIRNAAVSKEASLFGSDDKGTWYALKDKFTLGNIENDQGTAEVKIIDFPSSEYAYYKLWINDSQSGPLNIIKVGHYKETPEALGYEEVPIRSVTQENDSRHETSYIKISLDTLRLIDRISWQASGMPMYQRPASLYALRETTDTRRRKNHYHDLITDFQMNSRHEGIQRLPTTKADSLLLEVSNGDNPPLTIGNVKVYQVRRYAVAWLKKDETYSLKFGDEYMLAPNYDIELFQDKIPAIASMAEILPGRVNLLISHADTGQATFFTTRLFVWIAIAVVILVLGVMSIRMVRQTSKEPLS